MEEIANMVRSGKCIVYPTSTQPALGCMPMPSALDGLFEMKKRPANMPVSIGVASIAQADELVEVPEDVHLILGDFPDGSLTIILKAKKRLDERLGGSYVAIRVVSHPIARELISMVGPLTATSANHSGEPVVRDCMEAAKILTTPENQVTGIDAICAGGEPSTLISWHTACESSERSTIEVVREGKISSGEIYSWWQKRT